MYRKIILAICLSMVMFMLTGCYKNIPAGYTGIKVNKYGDHKGIDQTNLVTGAQWFLPWSTEIFVFPTFMQTAIWTQSKTEGKAEDESITFQTNDGMSVNADISLAYSFQPEKVPALFNKYRKEPAEIQDTYLRSQIRNIFTEVASGYSVEEFLKNKGKFIIEVQKVALDKLKGDGMLVDTLSFIGAPRLPESVQRSIEGKIAATQMAETKQRELEQVKADAAKSIAAAQAEAETFRQKANAVTPELLKLKQLEVQMAWIEAWKAGGAKVPTFVGGSNGNSFLMNMSDLNK